MWWSMSVFKAPSATPLLEVHLSRFIDFLLWKREGLIQHFLRMRTHSSPGLHLTDAIKLSSIWIPISYLLCCTVKHRTSEVCIFNHKVIKLKVAQVRFSEDSISRRVWMVAGNNISVPSGPAKSAVKGIYTLAWATCSEALSYQHCCCLQWFTQPQFFWYKFGRFCMITNTMYCAQSKKSISSAISPLNKIKATAKPVLRNA